MTAERGEVQLGETNISYSITRSRRRKKTVEITLDPLDGVLVAAPEQVPADRVAEIVRKRAGWIIRNTNGSGPLPQPKAFVSGESLPYLGRQVRLFVEPTRRRRAAVRFSHWSFVVQAPEAMEAEGRRSAIEAALLRWYRQRALERLTARVERWAPLVGCKPAQVLVRNQSRRWGSCGPDGSVRFNWRTVMAEPWLIDYVVVHELAHLLVRDHSVRYWQQVAQVMPDFRERRRRLKELGPFLAI